MGVSTMNLASQIGQRYRLQQTLIWIVIDADHIIEKYKLWPKIYKQAQLLIQYVVSRRLLVERGQFPQEWSQEKSVSRHN